MKRFALLVVAASVVGAVALPNANVHAYGPADPETLVVTPQQGRPGFEFTETVLNCFPGEPVILAVAVAAWSPPQDDEPLVPPSGADVIDRAVEACPEVGALQVSSRFTAPNEVGIYPVIAFMAAGTGPTADVPDRPVRLLAEYIEVCNTCIPLQSIGGFTTGGNLDPGADVVTTGGAGDGLPSFLSSIAFYRTFLALLAVIVGFFLVWLWRQRREDERLSGTYGASGMAAADPGKPWMA